MNDSIQWFLGPSKKPTGPFTEGQILERLKQGRLAETSLCWHKGAAKWKPLRDVEPFAAVFAEANRKRRRRALLVAAAATLVVGGVLAVSYLRGPEEIRRARDLIGRGQYAEAEAALSPYLKTHPKDTEAAYCLASAKINDCVVQPADRKLPRGWHDLDNSLPESAQQALNLFKRVCQEGDARRLTVSNDLRQILARVPTNAPDPAARLLIIQRMRQQLNLAAPKLLAGELLEKAATLSFSGQEESQLEVLANQILEWDPQQQSAVARLCLRAAAEARESNPRWARTALDNAAQKDASLARTDDFFFLSLELTTQSGQDRLRRCQTFLRDHPASPRRADVLRMILQDAIPACEQVTGWGANRGEEYLVAGETAALQLLKVRPVTPGLDDEVFAFASHLARLGGADESEAGGRGGSLPLSSRRLDNSGGTPVNPARIRRALDLTAALLKAFPTTGLQSDISAAQARWRRAQFGNLDATLLELAEQTERDLRILYLTNTAAVRILRDDPSAVHVVDVRCSYQDFSSDQADALRRWVANGGIAWIRNDVLRLFQIPYASSGWQSSVVCGPLPAPKFPASHILTGCRRVSVFLSGQPHAIDLKHLKPVALLLSDRRVYWSLIPHGEGWISNVPEVDMNHYDGARIWLNFRLFCLGRSNSIPGVARSPKPAETKE